MPALVQKHQRGQSSTSGAPRNPPPPPPPALSQYHDDQASEWPPSSALPPSRGSQTRSSSVQPPPHPSEIDGPAKLHSGRRPSPEASIPRVRSRSAHPPTRSSTYDHARVVSSPLTPIMPRPTSKHSNEGADSTRGRLRKTWMPGGRARSGSEPMSKDLNKMAPNKAWIMASDNHAEYNTAFLLNGEKVPELWNENGRVLVHLYPKGSGKGPSFKIPAPSIEASIVFHELIQGELDSQRHERVRSTSFTGRDSLTADDAARLPQNYNIAEMSSGDVHLYIPPPLPHSQTGLQDDSDPSQPDLRRLIAIRNLFAFLTGQPLVGIKAHPTIFSAFLEISALLKEFDFMSMDGTTWGEAVDMSFGFYMAQLALADVRHSREKTLEALVLGERMKCWELYNEAYTHAVGKWQSIVSMKSSLTQFISPEVLQRLERANIDLRNRQDAVNLRLEEFEFPALFAGVANSSEFKNIRTNRWKTSFLSMRRFTLDYYKSLFGSWPPKARSKKNPFSESGLNRLVLKTLYADLCSLYDLLVDRDSLTPRVIDQAPDEVSDKENDPAIKLLRKILSEFDQSSPPVLPPIPFDVPKIPTMKSVQPKYDEMKEKDRARFDRKIKEHEMQLVMHKSYNFDTDTVKTPFLELFKDFDMDMVKGKNSGEMADNRMGIWLFLYVVIQSLPLLVVDAPDLHFTEGVEYFLCQPPMGNAPWNEDAGATRKAWYQIPGSSLQVELSADVVMFSTEATYDRSHCWEVAKLWDEAKLNGENADLLGLPPPPNLPLSARESDPLFSPLQPPGAVFEDMDPINGYNSSNGGSPASSAPASPSSGPLRRVPAPGSGLAQGRGTGSQYRSSFAGVVPLEMLPSPIHAPVDRRASRVYSAQMQSRSNTLTTRPQSAGGGAPGPGSLRSVRSSSYMRAGSGSHAAESPIGGPSTPRSATPSSASHGRNQSSTFDDILKDISGDQQQQQQQQDKTKKPTKKKFGL
ncbi:hypothetical protein BD289DRAFT_358813 [Coniella lustricola]|uniref:DUF8004 domain-containing protein n=1 Tax=Coniella lustricola TaxID=2025994 RepID=A0A2T3AMY6_9PEZI|nr:hypothetical protein BD289DRAFT_358813 [Coniella lustricola]